MYPHENGNVPLEMDASVIFGTSRGYRSSEVSFQSRQKSRKREECCLQKSSACVMLGKPERSGNRQRITQVETLHEATSGNMVHVFS